MDGSLEKDINLEIARKLKHYLEASDVTVVMTREADRGLYGEKDSSKKMADMKNRCELISRGTKGTPAGRINGRQRQSSHILSMPGRAGPDRK